MRSELPRDEGPPRRRLSEPVAGQAGSQGDLAARRRARQCALQGRAPARDGTPDVASRSTRGREGRRAPMPRPVGRARAGQGRQVVLEGPDVRNPAMLYPMFALAAWTILVLMLVPLRRVRSALRREVGVDDFKYGESAAVPGAVSIPHRNYMNPVSYTHLRAHETDSYL